MKISTVISEVAHEGRICMEPTAMAAYRSLFFSNISMGLEVENKDKEHAEKQVIGVSGNGMCSQYIFPSDAFSSKARREFYGSLQADDDVVNVITIAGPMTRGGGACSYGSIDHRNLIMEAADIPNVRAHIILARTPGGMASTLRDYRQAFNYARQHGQKVWFFCDGDVASGGAFASTMSDGVYAFNPDDEIGSLGMYCAFFTQKNGDKNVITQETYHEYYATASKKKNDWYRAAEEGDMSLVAQSVEEDLAQLLANVKADRPQVKEEQLEGAMYRMGDVEGSLIDGFMSLRELASMAIKEWYDRQGAEVPAKNGFNGELKSAAQNEEQNGEDHNTNTNNNKPQIENSMKNYPNLGKVAGLEDAFELQADGFVSVSEEQADIMEAAIEKATEVNEATNQALTDAQAKVEELTKENDSLGQQLTEANNKVQELQTALTAKEEELTNAQATAETATADAQKAHEEEVANLQQQLETAKTDLASREATINDLNATIEELNASAGDKQNGGGAPQNNGKGVDAPTYSMEGQYDHSLSPAENRKRIEAYNKKLAAMAQANK